MKYKYVMFILSVGRCLIVNKKIFYSTLMQMTMQYPQYWKTLKKSQNFLEKDDSRSKFPVISLLKYGRFWKSHIYFERGDAAASSYTKNSISIFLKN